MILLHVHVCTYVCMYVTRHENGYFSCACSAPSPPLPTPPLPSPLFRWDRQPSTLPSNHRALPVYAFSLHASVPTTRSPRLLDYCVPRTTTASLWCTMQPAVEPRRVGGGAFELQVLREVSLFAAQLITNRTQHCCRHVLRSYSHLLNWIWN